jgi:hypothetical protein
LADFGFGKTDFGFRDWISVKAPAKKANIAVTNADVVAIIQTIEVAPFDFDIAGSRTEKAAIGESRALLVNNSLAEGRALWVELVTRARDTRLGSGTLDIADLRRALRTRFSLKGNPRLS